MKRQYFTYIISSSKNTTLYTGMTNNLVRRIGEHKTAGVKTFSGRYRTRKLLHYEVYSRPMEAIRREKQFKSWSRKRKNDLISKNNPTWEDLYHQLIDGKQSEEAA